MAGDEGATRHYCGRCDGGDDGKAWHCNTRGGQHVSVRKTKDYGRLWRIFRAMGGPTLRQRRQEAADCRRQPLLRRVRRVRREGDGLDGEDGRMPPDDAQDGAAISGGASRRTAYGRMDGQDVSAL